MAETDALLARLRSSADVQTGSAGSTVPKGRAAPTAATAATGSSAPRPALMSPQVSPPHGFDPPCDAPHPSPRPVLLGEMPFVGREDEVATLEAAWRAGRTLLVYAAFTRALRALTGPTPALGDLPAWVARELTRLLPELGESPPPLRSAAERGRFVEACTQGWLALAADNNPCSTCRRTAARCTWCLAACRPRPRWTARA